MPLLRPSYEWTLQEHGGVFKRQIVLFSSMNLMSN